MGLDRPRLSAARAVHRVLPPAAALFLRSYTSLFSYETLLKKKKGHHLADDGPLLIAFSRLVLWLPHPLVVGKRRPTPVITIPVMPMQIRRREGASRDTTRRAAAFASSVRDVMVLIGKHARRAFVKLRGREESVARRRQDVILRATAVMSSFGGASALNS